MKKNKAIQNKLAAKVGALRKKEASTQELLVGIYGGDKASLARAITLVESTKSSHFEKAEELIGNCLKNNTNSIRIGITGIPGVGKSTFIEVFGSHLTQLGKKVAVLAVDPSSSFTKGSILGDKTRMETLAKNPNAFIRPSPTSDSLGGVTRKSRETIILCEAAGYDVILVETVGVGQSETVVHSMVDFFLLLKLAGAGDELQGIKRGIMEMADAVVINKADGTNLKNVKLAQTEFNRALHLYPPKENEWNPKVLSCSSLENKGITEIWDMIETFTQLTKKNSYFAQNRSKQNKNWFLQTVNALLNHQFYQNIETKNQLERLLLKVEKNEMSPFVAAKTLVSTTK